MVLRNSDAAILAESGGRRVYNQRVTRYSDYNRATDSLRQVGSAMKPLVYLAAFREGLDLDSLVPDEPIQVALGNRGAVKEFANFDSQFKGPIAARQALAESRNVVAVWIAAAIGMREVIADRPGPGDPHTVAGRRRHGSRSFGDAAGGDRERLSRHGLGGESGAPRHRPHHERGWPADLRGPPTLASDSLRRAEADPGGAARCGPPAERHRPQSR